MASSPKVQKEIEAFTNNLPTQRDSSVDESIRNFLASPLIKKRLEDLLTDDQLADEFLKLSYIHLNGFRKLVIFSSLDHNFHIRLHQWLKRSFLDQNIHSHRFTFWSLVLKGSIMNRIWDISQEGTPFTHYRYEPRDGREVYEMRKVGDVILKEASSFSVNEDELYFFDSKTLHTTEYTGSPLTLLLEDRRNLLSYADVYVRRGKEYEEVVKYDSPALSLTEYREAIKNALTVMGA